MARSRWFRWADARLAACAALALGADAPAPALFAGEPEARTADLAPRDDPGCPCITLPAAPLVAASGEPPAPAAWLDADPKTAACGKATFEVVFAAPTPVDRVIVYPGDLRSARRFASGPHPATVLVRTDLGAIAVAIPEPPGDDFERRTWRLPEVSLGGPPIRRLSVTVTGWHGDPGDAPCWSGVGIEVEDTGG